MFPKSINGKNDKSNDRPDDRIREEIEAESEIGYGSAKMIGNRAMIDLLDGSSDGGNAGGNEDNNSLISGGGLKGKGLLGRAKEDEEIDLNDSGIFADEKNDNGSIIHDGNNINNDDQPGRAKAEEIREQEEEINNEKDPVKALEKVPAKVMGELMGDLEEENSELNKGFIEYPPEEDEKLFGEKDDPEDENSELNRGFIEYPPEEDEKSSGKKDDLNKAEEDLKPAEGFNFRAVKIPERVKQGGGRRFLSGLAWYSGKTLGKLVGLALNALYWPAYFPYWVVKKLFGFRKGKPRIDPEKFQRKRRHDLIQGWDGKKYQKQIPGERMKDDPIEVDFRKIPGVWAQMTAGKAEDENHKPIKPVITVYVAEPKEMTDDLTSFSDIGHTYIGLEFSHFSKVTNRFERYVTKYGLFAPGGDAASAYIAGHYYDATLPAQLLNDANYGYKISQSFPAEPKQVNDIMKASETYADKGYRLYDRNCTTFVKEMVVDIADIKAAEHILAPEELRMTHGINFGSFLAAGFSMNARLGMHHIFGEMGAQEDMSYERLGNKRAMKEEYDRYQKTKDKGGSWKKFGMSPNSAAENMRRVKGPNPALINSMKYLESAEENKTLSFADVAASYGTAADDVNRTIRDITPEELLDIDKVPDEFARIFMSLLRMADPLDDISDEMNAEDERNKREPGSLKPENYACITTELLREKRGQLMANIGDLNTLLFKYFQNDQRLHLKFIKLFGILNFGVDMIDETYRKIKKGRRDAGDLGDFREGFNREMELVKAGGKGEFFTASHYESYLQIYKTPEKAVERYSRYKELLRRENNKEHLSAEEKKDLAKLKRLEKLALEFDNAHNYMLDKEGYRQQDIDYAFSLGVKERQNHASGEMFNKNKTASDVYKAAILEKIFGGMRDRIMKGPDEGGISEEDSFSSKAVREWLDRDMSTRAEKNLNGFRMVLKAIKRSLKDPDRMKIYAAVNTMFQDSWFPHALPQTDASKVSNVGTAAPISFNMLWMEGKGRFPKLVLKMIDMVLDEDKDYSPKTQAMKEAEGE